MTGADPGLFAELAGRADLLAGCAGAVGSSALITPVDGDAKVDQGRHGSRRPSRLRHRPFHRRRLAGPGHRGHRGAGARAGHDGARSRSRAGVAIGDVVWLTFAVVGLAALAQAFHGVFLAIKYAGAAYLLYLAWKLWTAPVAPREVARRHGAASTPSRLFLGGLALTMGNPKVMVFYLALLPTLLDLTAGHGCSAMPNSSPATLAVLAVVFGAYIVLAARARRLFTSRGDPQASTGAPAP